MWLLLSVAVKFLLICGLVSCEELSNETGTLENTGYPYSMKNHEKYIWNFNISSTKSLVYLNLENVQLRGSDVLTISDGLNIYNWSSSDVHHHQFYILNPLSGNVTLEAGSDNSTIQPRRFQAYYTAKDSENVLYYDNAKLGVIKSPVYSEQKQFAYFTWVITEKPEENIYLAFKSFNLTDGNLTVDYGSTQLNLTGNSLPEDVIITGNVKLTLQLNLEVPEQQFELLYSYLYPNCSKKVELGSVTAKKVSFYGEPSEVPTQCFIIVEGPANSVLSVSAHWDEIENPNDVLLVLGDGPSRFSPMLLADSPANRPSASNVITKTNKLWIGYSYSSSIAGINASVDVVVQNQGRSLTQSGNFGLTSTTSNETLASNTSVYILNVKEDEQIVTNLAENTTLNGRNKLTFYDGGNTEEMILEFIAGDVFHPVISTKNQMMIVAEHFAKNESFVASFIAAPKDYNQLSSKEVGTFDIEQIFTNNSRSWIITPTLTLNLSVDEVINLIVRKADLNPDLKMTIYDGPTNAFPVVYTLSNISLESTEIHIRSNKGAAIVLENKGNFTFGLIADLSYKKIPSCNYSLDLRTSKSGFIRSLNYPNFYPSNAKCEWHITSNNYTLLSFNYLNLSEAHQIQVYSVNGSETKFLFNISGSQPVNDMFIGESHILLNWSSIDHSNIINVSKGFEIQVYSLDCGGIYDGTSKTFSTPNYPQILNNSTLCVWSINIPSKQSDKVEIIDLSYTTISEKANLATLTAYEGGSLKSSVISNFSSTNFLSRTNLLTIKYNCSNDAKSCSAYSFNYQPYVCSQLCGNGICMHDSWKCNGVNDCEDFTDETNCTTTTIIQETNGVSVTSLVVAILLCLTIGAVGAIAAPIVWRRIRAHGRNYHEFRNSVDA
ncbi:hypothetical protein CHUAL_006071 [Chamberlinius hualienensis]